MMGWCARHAIATRLACVNFEQDATDQFIVAGNEKNPEVLPIPSLHPTIIRSVRRIHPARRTRPVAAEETWALPIRERSEAIATHNEGASDLFRMNAERPPGHDRISLLINVEIVTRIGVLFATPASFGEDLLGSRSKNKEIEVRAATAEALKSLATQELVHGLDGLGSLGRWSAFSAGSRADEPDHDAGQVSG